jgi:murein DD-endopeptidase MepM/ murein hydrolase activator NlpD
VLQSPDLSAQDLFAAYHTVAEGETLGGIAATYGISVASLFWANGLDPDRLLTVGQELRIPRRSGLLYIVQPNDTIAAIAARFQVPVAALTLFRPNHITHDRDLSTGQELFLPGATQPYPSEILQHFGGEPGIAAMQAIVAGSVHEDETNLRAGPGRAYTQVALLPAGTLLTPLARHAEWVQVSAGAIGVGWVRADLVALSERALQALPETNDFPPAPPRWVWPTYGELTSPFGWRTVPFRSFHNGIDIANRAGTPIVAARTGTVIEAGWCSGFGFCVKLNHGGGVTTIYGHMLRKPRVSAGESVAAGDLIGLMGSTFDRAGGGYSTGVHLHFTVKVAGKAVDPRKYLP